MFLESFLFSPNQIKAWVVSCTRLWSWRRRRRSRTFIWISAVLPYHMCADEGTESDVWSDSAAAAYETFLSPPLRSRHSAWGLHGPPCSSTPSPDGRAVDWRDGWTPTVCSSSAAWSSAVTFSAFTVNAWHHINFAYCGEALHVSPSGLPHPVGLLGRTARNVGVWWKHEALIWLNLPKSGLLDALKTTAAEPGAPAAALNLHPETQEWAHKSPCLRWMSAFTYTYIFFDCMD